MNSRRLIPLTLITVGALTGLIGLGILLVPDAFYASYGIAVPESPSLGGGSRAAGVDLHRWHCRQGSKVDAGTALVMPYPGVSSVISLGLSSG